MGEQGYVPFGEFKPDLKYLSNDGLLDARNVIPVYGSYLSALPSAIIAASVFSGGEIPVGLHVATANRNGYIAAATAAFAAGDIVEVTEAGVVTNRTRTAAGNYTSAIGLSSGCSFGDNVILPLWPNLIPATPTNPVQYLASGATRFADLITTAAFAPLAKFAFPFKINLFLAHCQLGAPYDGLSAGLNNKLVAWSANKNIRQFGSSNANPELTGAGYQELAYDMGEITGAVSGDDYAMIALEGGFVRIDGPPYTFRALGRGHGVHRLSPNAMCMAGADVYYLGPAGLGRLRGGDGNPEQVGSGAWSRWLIDNATGFSSAPIAGTGGSAQMFYDAANDLIFMLYYTTSLQLAMLTYNIGENRASYWIFPQLGSQPVWMGNGINLTSDWLPGRDLRFVDGSHRYAKFALGNFTANSILQRGYIQFKPDRSTRLLRVRPIYNVSDQAAIEQISVTIETTNKPYGTPTTKGPYSAIDSATGWISTPDAVFGDFHSLKFTVTANANMHKVVEYEGFEYDIALGPQYAG